MLPSQALGRYPFSAAGRPYVADESNNRDLLQERFEQEPLAILTDKHGQQYEVIIDENDDKLLWLSLQVEGWEVGYLRCTFISPEDMFIEDFLIRDWTVLRGGWMTRLLRKIRNKKDRYRNFQRLGLGSQFLDVLIAYANGIGVRHICGRIIQKDRDNNPKLIEFYQDHGFQITGRERSRIDLYLY